MKTSTKYSAEMKTTNPYKLLIMGLFLLAATCEPKVKFENPQPNGRKDLKAIPANYRGTYFEISDSVSLTINETLIIEEELRIALLTKQQLWEEIDTVFEVDTIVNVTKNTTVEFDFYDDSVKLTTQSIDTLFDLNLHSHLREYKGFLFLNNPLENNLWKVKIVKIKGDSLMMKSLVTESEIDTLRPLTQITTITDSIENKTEEYRMDPTKSEMKKILARKKLEYDYVRK